MFRSFQPLTFITIYDRDNLVPMDEDRDKSVPMDEEGLELVKARIDEELRRIRRANSKARKEDEDHELIAAGEGKL